MKKKERTRASRGKSKEDKVRVREEGVTERRRVERDDKEAFIAVYTEVVKSYLR